ncbi:polysaccharide biosynthesis protein [Alteribacillus sp. HJP-4]|uniref:polysaccharide biosynthesis protein n=1 Tax=Alteribacillus sp. HJP-4 TaxID=2775394 RepID=UPI0035CD0349
MVYRKKLAVTIVIDSIFILTALLMSSIFLYEYAFLASPLFYITLAGILIHFFAFSYAYRLYKKTWEYASWGEVLVILKTVGLTILMTAAFQQLIVQVITLRILVITFFLQIVFIGGSRLSWRIAKSRLKVSTNKKRTLIVGAGSAGTLVARRLQESQRSDLLPVAFVDDDTEKHHYEIYNIPVAGGTKDIKRVAEEKQIDNIVIAIPSLDRKRLNEIYQECAATKVKTQIMPMIEDLVTGKLQVNQFRDVRVEDLLGREPVELDYEAIAESVGGKVVLVTGAGGSIGSEICRQIARFHPHKLILLGHGENSIYSIEMELLELFHESPIEFVTEIADIQDAKKIASILHLHEPDVVYHAAAHKHVPLMERNPEEALKNNVIGTMNVAKAASSSRAETFVMISSDKAVNPTSVMGATKRLAEMVVQNMNQVSATRFAVVRFGNVLGSRGSVIPLFKKQIQKGGPVTVTHPEMVRYFMTIPEASRLVIQAGSLASGGETFVLDMGVPVKIVDLAKNLIKLSGHAIDDIGISYTGVRNGEKLYEELLNDNEVDDKQIYPKIYVGKPSYMFMEEIEDITSTFPLFDKETLREKLLELANRNAKSASELVEDAALPAEA